MLNDIEFRKRLIDNLVYKVYVSDTDTIIYFNIKGGNHIEEISFEYVKSELSNNEKVQTQGDPLRHKQIIRTLKIQGSYFLQTVNQTFKCNALRETVGFILNAK